MEAQAFRDSASKVNDIIFGERKRAVHAALGETGMVESWNNAIRRDMMELVHMLPLHMDTATEAGIPTLY